MATSPSYKSHLSLFFGVTIAALTGCSAPALDTALPAPPIAETWPVDNSSLHTDTASLHWREYFANTPLIELIDEALLNNRDLRLALLRVQEAQSLYGIQRAAQWPDIALGAQGTRARVPGDLNTSGQSRVGGEYRVNAGLSNWELDLWGRVQSLKESALQQYLATEANAQAASVALIAAVASTYIALRALDEQVAVARATIASREESFRIFTRRYEAGTASKLELAQVESLLHQARGLGAELEQTRLSRVQALTLLVGAPIDLPEISHNALRDSGSLAQLKPGLPSALLNQRADILAAEHRLRAANANIGAARAAFFPRIALTGTWGTASAELDGLFESGSRAWTFAPVVSLPVFDGGHRRSNLALSNTRREMALADYENTIQIAFREVSDALIAQQGLTRQVAIRRDAVNTQHERARLSRLSYDNGSSAYLEVLDAERDLLQAQQQYIDVRSQLFASQIALYKSLGGGAVDVSFSSLTP